MDPDDGGPVPDRLTQDQEFAGTVSLVIISFDRRAELVDAIASAAGRGFDEVVVLDNGSHPPLEPLEGVVWLRSEQNLGATGGRNHATTHAKGDILTFIDSDAVLLAPPHASAIANTFLDRPCMGVLGGLTRRSGGGIVDEEFPFRSISEPSRARKAPYFLECAVAVRRTAWHQAGGYDARYRIYHEAIDLAMRMHKAGWEVWFDPTLEVEHRPAAAGRAANPNMLRLRLRNRLLYCRRHLPFVIALVHGLIWVGHIGLRAGPRHLRSVAGGIREGLRTPMEREPINLRDAWALHRQGWRIFW